MLKIKYNNEYENDSWNKNPYKTEDGNIKEKSPLMPDVVNLKYWLQLYWYFNI